MDPKEKIPWREEKLSRSFRNAFRGLGVFFITTKEHLAIYFIVSILVIVAGFYYQISSGEWLSLIFAIGLVFVAEAFNTAIEIDMDLTSPEYHPDARDTKDVAAAAVLLAVLTAVIVGLIIFLPKVYKKIVFDKYPQSMLSYKQ